MKRRTLLATAASISSAFAGCTGFEGANTANGDETSPTEPPTETPTDPPMESPSESPTESPTKTPAASGPVTETSFRIVENECGTGMNEASVNRGTSQVTVEGTISGRNGCYTAELEQAAYDTDAGELTVSIRSFSNNGGNGGCTQCLVDIEYQATVSYDAPDPATVTVLHNGDEVD